jgi:hypothetical protein
MVCPYYNTGVSTCNFFDTYQDGYQKENYCLSSDNWKRCANYEKRSDSERINKRLR